MFSIVSDQENANQYHSDIPIYLAKILISDNTNHQRGYGFTGYSAGEHVNWYRDFGKQFGIIFKF